ncbi:MAG: prepilin peptidase, partial [Phycisphaerae bacterium]|nr:prepilin peptidase [Phycisphaerae bacterium]
MDAFWVVMLFALGTCIGSFLNVVIYRLPRGESIVFPGSHCPSCGRKIKWYDNIPLLSYLLLLGRCRFCKIRISPRYLVIEAVTAFLVAGLYVCYFVLGVRDGAGGFVGSWPMFAAHAALLCGLLACAVVDIESWIVPLEVCWFVPLVGLVSAAASPPSDEFLPRISATTGAMSLAAALGIVIAIVMVRRGLIQRSFIDADGGDEAKSSEKPASVAITKAHGVNPRREVLREVTFLAPAIALAVIAHLLVTRVAPIGDAWAHLTEVSLAGRFAAHFNAFLAALFGYLIGALWVWGVRIFG